MESTLTLTEEEEKSQLRKKVADLMETIAAESANTADSQSTNSAPVKYQDYELNLKMFLSIMHPSKESLEQKETKR